MAQIVKVHRGTTFCNALGGTSLCNTTASQSIVVEINIPLQGINRSVSGLFAKDPLTNEVFLLHRGRVGGGKKGIGKRAFREWYRGKWIEVKELGGATDEAILIAGLSSRQFVSSLTSFVQQVEAFKREVSTGKLGREPQLTPTTTQQALTFDPEFSGTIRGKRKSTFEYETHHGKIVDALEQFLRQSRGLGHLHPFNNQLIDLAFQDENKLHTICEVKTRNDRQSIYTGIGQLFFHSAGQSPGQRILVLPEHAAYTELLEILQELNISLLQYRLSEDSVTFRW